MTDRLKALDEVFEPDPRMQLFWLREATGETRPVELRDVHSGIAVEVLTSHVPDDVRHHFETLRNIALYSWFVYRFIQVAQLYSCVCIEFALRRAVAPTSERSPGLARLIDAVAARGLLCDSDLRDIPSDWLPYHGPVKMGRGPLIQGAQWLQQPFADMLAYIRNDAAHGTGNLMPDAGRSIRITADIVNALFRNAPASA